MHMIARTPNARAIGCSAMSRRGMSVEQPMWVDRTVMVPADGRCPSNGCSGVTSVHRFWRAWHDADGHSSWQSQNENGNHQTQTVLNPALDPASVFRSKPTSGLLLQPPVVPRNRTQPKDEWGMIQTITSPFGFAPARFIPFTTSLQ